jgi:hypothetical protein
VGHVGAHGFVKALSVADVIREVQPAMLDSCFDCAAAEIQRIEKLIASADMLGTFEPRGNLYGAKSRKADRREQMIDVCIAH